MKPCLKLPLLAALTLAGAGYAADTVPPTLVSYSPTPGPVSALTAITVTFSEPVVGVEAEDLLVHGNPASSLQGAGSIYVFRFSQPPPGMVQVYFDVDHGITDLAGNAFEESAPGAVALYTVRDTVPPTVASTVPTAGASVSQLTQAQVTFSEPVTGVDAADLRVNGVAAVAATGTGAGPYVFTLGAPASGTVSLTWAAGHGIRDLAEAPNGFAGGGWSVTLDPALTAADVIINEFMAAAILTNVLADEDREASDWIELHNRGPVAVNLLGWSVSNEADLSSLWIFPAVTLGPGQFLVVFASGKDRKPTTPGGRLHTNFQLNRDGEYLGLFNAEFPPRTMSEYAPKFPQQRNDVSFGYDPSGNLRYFAYPTPGASNGPSTIVGAAAPVHFSVGRGFFNTPFHLTLGVPTPGASIRYTTDGSEPTLLNGQTYGVPLLISNTTLVRAAAFRSDLLPSLPRTHSYFFPEAVLLQSNRPPGFPTNWVTRGGTVVAADYELDRRVITNALYTNLVREGLTNLPTLSIVMKVGDLFSQSNGIYANPQEVGLTWERPASAEFIFNDGADAVQVDAGFRVQGGTSREPTKSYKHSTRLLFRGMYGSGTLDYPLFADSPVSRFNTLILDASLNNVWHHRQDAEQRRMGQGGVRDQVVADLHNAMGRPAFHGRYFNVFFNGLYWGTHYVHERPDEDFAESYFGGDKDTYDVLKNTTSFEVIYGNAQAWNETLALCNAGLANEAQYQQLQQYIDPHDVADYFILNVAVGNSDWPHHNWYVARERRPGATWKLLVWDAEHVFKDGTQGTNYDNSTVANASTPAQVYDFLRRYNAEFRLLFADHVHRHFFNDGVLTTNGMRSFYLRRIQEIDKAITLESARWGDTINNTVRPGQPYERNYEYLTELNRLLNTYFPVRSEIVLRQFKAIGLYPTNAVAPLFSQHGGRVPRGFNLFITNAPAGTVYYTTNGVDPRVYLAGTPAPTARIYTNGVPIVLGASAGVKARTLNGTNWSALNEAAFTVAELDSPLRITEIMYNPVGGDAFEFLELKNFGGVPLDLGGCALQGVSFTFPYGFTLAPGATLVLASGVNTNAFATNYPGVRVAGWWDRSSRLDNGGERLAVIAPGNRTLGSVRYDDDPPWPTSADGGGYSLELIDPYGDLNDPANWRASAAPKGTPGVVPPPPAPSALVLNEVMAENVSAVATNGGYPDWVELHNSGPAAASLDGWSLWRAGAPAFVFPPDTSVAPGGYRVVWCDTNTAAPGLHTGWSLDRAGGSLALFDAQGNRMDMVTFGPQVADSTIGRVGGAWQLTTPTPGATNVAATVAAQTNLVLNEWLADTLPGGADWLELFNRSSNAPASLCNLYLGTSNALFQVRSLSFVPPGGFVQLWADEAPGPDHLDFKLSRLGDAIVLYDETGALVDRVVYGLQAQGVSQGRLPDGSASLDSFPGSATPGASNYKITYTGPLLNEVMARNRSAVTNNLGRAADWIEIHNPAASAVNWAGWSLSVNQPEPGQWPFPVGLTTAGGDSLVIWCDNGRPATITWPATNLNTGRAIEGDSGGVYLFSPAGQLMDAVEFGFQVEDLSIGRSGGAWRLLASPTPGAANAAPATLGSPANLRLNEWMASPASGEDWFELHNLDSLPVALTGLFLTDDPSVYGQTKHAVPPLCFIGPKGFGKFQADGNTGAGRNHVGFNLHRLGETLWLLHTNRATIDAVNFGLQTEGVSMGRLPDGEGAIVSFGTTPSPGESNYQPLQDVVINEVLSHATGALEGAIELFNAGAQPVGVGGWFLSNDGRNFKKYRIPEGTTISNGGFLVVYENEFNAANPGTPFSLNAAKGDRLWLAQADGAGKLTGYRAWAGFGAAENSVSFGRYATSLGPEFPALSQRTFGHDNPATVQEFRLGTGRANAPPRVGPVVINEIMYHPPTLDGTNDNTLEEFVELCNLSGAAVALYDPAYPTNRWRLGAGVDFAFPPGTVLPAGGFVLVVNFDPVANPTQLEAFRARFGVATNVPVFGPYGGKLDNGGEAIELLKPEAPLATPPGEAGFVPYVLVDRVSYDDRSPWPGEADGGGSSLQRRRPYQYGNDPVNWKAAEPTAGRANVPGSTLADADGDLLPDDWELANGFNPAYAADALQDADGDGRANRDEYFEGTNPRSAASRLMPPAITVQPQSQGAQPGSNVTFTVAVSGTAPLQYQWRFNGAALPGATNAALTLNNVQTPDNGLYTVLAWNAAGFAVSQAAQLLINIPPLIVTQPQSVSVLPGASVAFNVTATGTGLLRYQWRFNDLDLPGATAASLSLTNVQLTNSGPYTVRVSDDVGFAISQPAMLTVRVPPTITRQPESVTAAVGASVSLSISADGTLPLSFRWRRNGATFTNMVVNQNTSVLAFPSVQTNHAGIFTVVVTNIAGVASSLSSNAYLTVVLPPTNQTVPAGATVTLTGLAVGPTNSYQWQFRGTNLPGATSASLVLSNAQPANEGLYTLLVINAAGTPTPFPATLTVVGPPTLSQPQVLTNGAFQMLVQGPVAQNCAIEISPDLTNWSTLATLVLTNNQTPFVDATAGATNRFYRARLAQ